jgi:hypothetical protein
MKTPTQCTDKTDKSQPFVSKWQNWKSEKTPTQYTDKTDKRHMAIPFVSFVSASESAFVEKISVPTPRDAIADIAPDLPPCAVCGGADRWCDIDVWRCRVCAPVPLTAQARAVSVPEWPPTLPPPVAHVTVGVTPVCFHHWETAQEGTATCLRCGLRVSVQTEHDTSLGRA